MHLINRIIGQGVQFIPHGILTDIRTHIGNHQRILKGNRLRFRVEQVILVTIHQSVNTILSWSHSTNREMSTAVGS